MPIFILTVSFLIYGALLTFLIAGIFRLPKKRWSEKVSVSVVTAARNEQKNIEAYAQAVLNQSYAQDKTEIIVVNDRSTDGTGEILNRLQQTKKHLRVIHIENRKSVKSPKKTALSRGIANATGDVIFTTDADCLPPKNWLKNTVTLFNHDTGVVIGTAPFFEQTSTWSRVLALDNLSKAFVAAGAAGWNIGLTCTGRNLAYRKRVFEEVNGFSEIEHSLSGDDDLFLQTVMKRTSWKITYSLNPETAVPSAAPRDLKSYIKQKRRHVSAGKHYGLPQKTGYFLFDLTNLLLFSGVVATFFTHTDWLAPVFLFLGKLLFDFFALSLVTNKLQKNHLLVYFPLWELFYVASQTFIAPLGFLGKITWKN